MVLCFIVESQLSILMNSNFNFEEPIPVLKKLTKFYDLTAVLIFLQVEKCFNIYFKVL